jgi:hypothetical protein
LGFARANPQRGDFTILIFIGMLCGTGMGLAVPNPLPVPQIVMSLPQSLTV